MALQQRDFTPLGFLLDLVTLDQSEATFRHTEEDPQAFKIGVREWVELGRPGTVEVTVKPYDPTWGRD